MRYNQPYGITDPDAPYINGNPTTGTMGSIPPAASIEHPQREIVNFIKDSSVTPDGADVRQLSKSVQNGVVNYCQDQGTPNFIAITPVPPIVSYQLGQYFRIRMAYPNTGPMRLNASGVGFAPVVHGDKSEMGGGETYEGQIIEVAWDGAGNWQMLTGGMSGTLIMMTAPRSLYCNATTGSDTLYDGTQASVDAVNGHGPFKTLRHALDVMTHYNLSGFTFNIYMADGTYFETAAIVAPIPNGSGNISIHGNHASPQNVKLYNTGTGSCLAIRGGTYTLDGVSLQSTAPSASDSGINLWVSDSGTAWVNAVSFYSSPSSHIYAGQGGGHINIVGPIGIYGNGGGHMGAVQNGTITFWGNPLPTLNVYNAVSLNYFAYAASGGQIQAMYTAINLTGAVTGTKYAAIANGVVDSGGRGASYLPGTVAGVTSTGGQYV